MKKFLFSIDGLDASGKLTQTRLAEEFLTVSGVPCRTVSFPTYDSRSSALVNMYLSGEFGSSPDSVNAYAASSFFALDRYASFMTDWKADYDRGTVILANRYTTANAVHQLSKLPRERWEDFLDWLYGYEYGLLGLPKPDAVIFLKMPPELSAKMIGKRCEETGAKRDIHESDLTHLERSAAAADYAAAHGGWITVDCAPGGAYRTREDIASEIAAALSGLVLR